MNLLDQRPDSPEWRADALARSGHSKLAAEGVRRLLEKTTT